MNKSRTVNHWVRAGCRYFPFPLLLRLHQKKMFWIKIKQLTNVLCAKYSIEKEKAISYPQNLYLVSLTSEGRLIKNEGVPAEQEIFQLTLIKMGLFRAAHGWGRRRKVPLPKFCHTDPTNDDTWPSYALPKEDPKNI